MIGYFVFAYCGLNRKWTLPISLYPCFLANDVHNTNIIVYTVQRFQGLCLFARVVNGVKVFRNVIDALSVPHSTLQSLKSSTKATMMHLSLHLALFLALALWKLAQILKVNLLATFSPCASHTLNLVGVHAAESCPEVATFFDSVNRLYNLFSACPERWAILKEKTGFSLHRLSDTRWSARIAAVRVVAVHLPSILEALECVLATCSLASEAKSEANGLISYFKTFDAIVLLTVWVKILQCIENRNVILQAGDISLDVQAANIKALQEEMQALRDRWDSLLAEASLVAQTMDVPDHFRTEKRRKRKRKRMPDEMTQEDATTEDSAENAFRNKIFFVVMDSIISALSARFQTTAKICETFAPILKLTDMTAEQIKEACQTLAKMYDTDLSEKFENEVLHFRTIYDATFSKTLSSLELLNAIWKMQLQSIFGELCIVLRIFCTLPVTVAGGERAFSKLKLVKKLPEINNGPG